MLNQKSQKAIIKIVDAFLQLLNTKSFEKITIKELMENAGVARSVFYSHFKTKEDVFSYISDQLYSFLTDHMMEEDYFTSNQIIWDYINLYDKYGHIFIMLQYNNVDVILTKKMFSDVIKSLHLSCNKDDMIKEYTDYYLSYLVASIVAVTMNWVKNGKQETKEEIFEIIKYFKLKNLG